jgi:hypothetical protein
MQITDIWNQLQPFVPHGLRVHIFMWAYYLRLDRYRELFYKAHQCRRMRSTRARTLRGKQIKAHRIAGVDPVVLVFGRPWLPGHGFRVLAGRSWLAVGWLCWLLVGCGLARARAAAPRKRTHARATNKFTRRWIAGRTWCRGRGVQWQLRFAWLRSSSCFKGAQRVPPPAMEAPPSFVLPVIEVAVLHADCRAEGSRAWLTSRCVLAAAPMVLGRGQGLRDGERDCRRGILLAWMGSLRARAGTLSWYMPFEFRKIILHQKSFLILYFFHTLPPPRLYIVSLLYMCIRNPYLFFIFFAPFHLLRTLGHGIARGEAKEIVAPLQCLSFVLFSCKRHSLQWKEWYLEYRTFYL